tara:strand:- start:409 stop:1452 length:1044 start_codon:yes stop_codon:yes gene_type:complete
LKIKSDFFSNHIKTNFSTNKIIFLYGSNLGLIDLLYKQSIELLNIDMKDPFNVSKIDGSEFKDTPSILEDNINTLNIFSKQRFILLNLSHISIDKNIENIVLNAVETENDNFFLIIRAGNIGSQNKLIKYFEKSKTSILTPCYEENTNKVKSDLNFLFKRHKVSLSNDFVSNLSFMFNTDSLANKIELDKLDIFLINNKNITENSLLKFLGNNNNINLNKVVKACLNGESSNSLFYLDKIYEISNTNIILIRMFGKHLKILEKILLSNQHGKKFLEAINDFRPPIFFKDKSLFLSQCKLWSFKKLDLTQKRLIDLEFKIKTGLYPEKTLLSQFILSVSVLAKSKARS